MGRAMHDLDVRLEPFLDALGHKKRRTWADNRHLPGDEVWPAVGARTASAKPAAEHLAAGAGGCHQGALGVRAGHQRLKHELGLGHFERRSWTGLHRHAPMTCMAFAWLQRVRFSGHRPTDPGENAASCSGTATISQSAGRAPRQHGAAVRRSRRAGPLSALQTRTLATA